MPAELSKQLDATDVIIQALAFYSDPKTYVITPPAAIAPILVDKGGLARHAITAAMRTES